MRDIQMVLERWGVWSRHRYETDYSPIAAGFKGLLPSAASSGNSCTDSDALIIDACVGRLKLKLPTEHKLIEMYYILGLSKRKISKKLNCDEKSVRIKMMMAEGFIDGCLSMIEVKLDMDRI